jgi:uncharacterized protein (TIGR02246 family)
LADFDTRRTIEIMNTQTSLNSPADVSQAFVTAISEGDLPGALSLFREDAVMVAPDGQSARGAHAIEQLLAGLVSMQIDMDTRIDHLVEAGDVAIASESWTMRLRGPDGTPSEQRGQSLVVFGHDQRGWRLKVDAPWGL